MSFSIKTLAATALVVFVFALSSNAAPGDPQPQPAPADGLQPAPENPPIPADKALEGTVPTCKTGKCPIPALGSSTTSFVDTDTTGGITGSGAPTTTTIPGGTDKQ